MLIFSTLLYCALAPLFIRRPEVAVSVDMGITVSGAGVTAVSITSISVLFPLRLGFACAAGFPLQTVAVTDVSSVVAGVVIDSYPVILSNDVNLRTAACPLPANGTRRLQSLGSALYFIKSLRGHSGVFKAAPRAAYVVSSGTAPVNGSYVIVRLSISVDVPAAAVDAASGNVSAIPVVANVIAATSQLLPTSSSSAVASSAVLDAAYGPFLAAAAAAAGVNASALIVGSTGAPTAAIASSGSRPATVDGSPTPGLSGGAIAGIVISLLLLVCLAFACCCIVVRRGRKEDKPVVGGARTSDVLLTQSNPLRAPNATLAPVVFRPQEPLLVPTPSASKNAELLESVPPRDTLPGNTDALPVILNPMLAQQRDLRSVSSVAQTPDPASTGSCLAIAAAAGVVVLLPSRKPLSQKLSPSDAAPESLAGIASAAVMPMPGSARRPVNLSLDAYTNPLSRALIESVAAHQHNAQRGVSVGIDIRGESHHRVAAAACVTRGAAAALLESAEVDEGAPGDAAAVAARSALAPQLPRLRREALLLPTSTPRVIGPSASASAMAIEDAVAEAPLPQLPRSRGSRVSRAGARAQRMASASAAASAPATEPGSSTAAAPAVAAGSTDAEASLSSPAFATSETVVSDTHAAASVALAADAMTMT